ncbi:MAG: hypothetical protein IJ608_13120 [Lachnospiraceae bacterium]|nr:hypothetical protein [Lachnospiraceae bacterium]
MKQLPKSKQNKIFANYAAYLDERSIPYYNRQGFYVCAPLKHLLPDGTPITRTRELASFIHVYDNFDGGLALYDYFGSCYTGIRIAKRVMKAIKACYPECTGETGYTFHVEEYTHFELGIYHEFKFTSIEDLHERVMKVAGMIEKGSAIGYDMIGEECWER